MPDMNRRSFMQLFGAAGLTPMAPLAPLVQPAPARAALGASGSATSKALWTSLYAKAGSQAEFIGMSRNMGLSNAAIQGVSARSIGVRVAASTLTQPLLNTSLESHAQAPSKGLMRLRINMKKTLEKYFWDDVSTHHSAPEKQNLAENISMMEPEDGHVDHTTSQSQSNRTTEKL